MFKVFIGQFLHIRVLVLHKLSNEGILINWTVVQQWYAVAEKYDGWLLCRTVQSCHLASAELDYFRFQVIFHLLFEVCQRRFQLVAIIAVLFG